MFSGSELERLELSIKKHGVKQPIVIALVDNKKVVLNGWHRVEIAKRLDIEVPVIIIEGKFCTVSARDLDIPDFEAISWKD